MFQSILMVVGVVFLFCLIVPLADPVAMRGLTTGAVQNSGEAFASGPGYAPDGRQFLPLALAISYFFVWPFAGVGSPAGMVRVMACKDSGTMRRSVILLSFYNLLIYLPLVVIFVAARSLMPNLANSDEVMPRLALWATQDLFGGSLLGGLILAAPFGAVMATVSSYLVMIASGVVRDVYQGFLRPKASDRELRLLSQTAMVALGAIAVLANISPVKFLQSLIVFSGTSQAATFVAPAIMVAFWRRATAAGAASAMLCGAVTMLGLSIPGWFGPDPMIDQASAFRPYYLGGFHPVVFGLAASAVAGVVVSLCTAPPPPELIERMFGEEGSGSGVRG
jgi:SSS family solute:Na+ symporter/sodium/pantothenate symporter